MLQVARLAPKLLGDSTGLVADFLRSQQEASGGFVDREGKNDLYYTVFGMAWTKNVHGPGPYQTPLTHILTWNINDWDMD